MLAAVFEQQQSFVVQLAGFQHEHRDVELQTVDQVGDHHVFGPQAGGLRDLVGAAEFASGLA